MPFFVYGNNASTGTAMPHFFSQARTESEARKHGELHGMVVTRLVPCGEDQRPPDAGDSAAIRRAIEAKVREPENESVAFREELVTYTPRAFTTWLLAGSNVAVFLLMLASGAGFAGPSAADLVRWGAGYGPPTIDGEWWRLLTALFVHAGIVHLGYNLLALALVAPAVERMIGNVGFLLLYLVAGIGGNLFTLYWDPLLVHVGASGAIFGVYGALLALLLRRRGAIPQRIASRLTVYVLAFVCYGLMASVDRGVAWTAHVGGLLTGFLCGFLADRPLSHAPPSRHAIRNALVAGLGILLVATGVAGAHFGYVTVADHALPALQAHAPSREDMVWGLIYLLTAASLFLGAFGLRRGIADIVYGKASRDWPQAAGKIEDTSADSWYYRGAQYVARIRYSYSVAGKAYVGRRIGFGKTGDNERYARTTNVVERILARYPVGRSVPVYYSPSAPGICTLEPGVNVAGVLTNLVLGVMMMTMGLFLLFVVVTLLMR